MSVAPELLSTKASNAFASFFTDKIKKLDSQSVPPYQVKDMCCPCVHFKINLSSMTQFHPTNHKNLEDIIHHLKSSSCCLDILPAGFFIIISNCIAADPLQIFNTSVGTTCEPQFTTYFKTPRNLSPGGSHKVCSPTHRSRLSKPEFPLLSLSFSSSCWSSYPSLFSSSSLLFSPTAVEGTACCSFPPPPAVAGAALCCLRLRN